MCVITRAYGYTVSHYVIPSESRDKTLAQTFWRVKRSTYLYIYIYVYVYVCMLASWSSLMVAIHTRTSTPPQGAQLYIHAYVCCALGVQKLLFSTTKNWLVRRSLCTPGCRRFLLTEPRIYSIRAYICMYVISIYT